MVRREARDQVLDAVADLQREVGRRRAHQLAHVLGGGLAADAARHLVLAHGGQRYGSRYGFRAWTGTSCVISSSRPWAASYTVFVSPRIQTRL